MKITTKLELHQLAIKLIDSIAYERPVSDIKYIVDDLSTKFKNDPELRGQEKLSKKI